MALPAASPETEKNSHMNQVRRLIAVSRMRRGSRRGRGAAIVEFALVAAIFLLLIPFSHWWMKRFRYGPAEWLWRSMTYLKQQPMRRSQ